MSDVAGATLCLPGRGDAARMGSRVRYTRVKAAHPSSVASLANQLKVVCDHLILNIDIGMQRYSRTFVAKKR
jgi:hypothetical protein